MAEQGVNQLKRKGLRIRTQHAGKNQTLIFTLAFPCITVKIRGNCPVAEEGVVKVNETSKTNKLTKLWFTIGSAQARETTLLLLQVTIGGQSTLFVSTVFLTSFSYSYSFVFTLCNFAFFAQPHCSHQFHFQSAVFTEKVPQKLVTIYIIEVKGE